MFRRDVVLELGGYDESLGPSEDKDLWRKLALRRLEGRIVESELIRYRLHTRQLSRIHEERQRRHDGESHRAFLRTLAGGVDVDAERLRLLLTADARFFAYAHAGAGALHDLDALLRAAGERLSLSAGERERLERLVRGRVARAALCGWREDVAAWWRTSPPLARYGLQRGGARAATDAVAYALTLPLAPVLDIGSRFARRVVRAAVGARVLRILEAPARRSPLARRVYSWMIGRS